MDVPGNFSTALQAIGRLFRLGQLEPQEVWLLCVDDTYDQNILGL